jgi:glycosyltransferase involved in cell wall biosynthesis
MRRVPETCSRSMGAVNPSDGVSVATDLVSVITPCYNAAAFLRETIDSVRNQTHESVEHIVVDDASTDGSWDVVRDYPGVRPVRLDRNQGGSRVRNVGFAQARGEFLMFLDADDVIAPETLAALVSVVRDRPGTIGICPWSRLRKAPDGTWMRVPAQVPLPHPGADHFKEWLDGTCWVPPCAVLWRRDAYVRTGGWDESLTLDDDAELMMRALVSGAVLTLAPTGRSFYRAHDDGLSLSTDVYSRAKIASRARVVEKLDSLLSASGRLASYAVPLGKAYQRVALLAYQHEAIDLGRKCQARGEALAGRRAVGRTLTGRALSRLFGLERREVIVRTLAEWGVGTSPRRELLRRLTASTDAVERKAGK